LSLEDVEREIVDFMHKALTLVENLDRVNSSKHAIYLYRSSIIHHKLASLYYRLFLEKDADKDKKARQLKQLAELHYSKATDGFRELVAENPCEFIRVQLERVALLEHSIENASSSTKQKLVHDALHLLFSCQLAYTSLARKLPSGRIRATGQFDENDDDSENDSDHSASISKEASDMSSLNASEGEVRNNSGVMENDQSLLKESTTLCDLTQQRLQALCRLSLKLSLHGPSSGSKSTQSKDKREHENSADCWKRAYAVTLKTKPKEITELPGFVLGMLEEVAKEI